MYWKADVDQYRVEERGVKSALLKITKRTKFEAHEIKGIVGGIEVDMGDARERFDTLDRGQQELKEELHTISKTWLEALQENVDDLKTEIHTAQGSQNERFDHLENAMATKGDIAELKDLILKLLQPKQGE